MVWDDCGRIVCCNSSRLLATTVKLKELWQRDKGNAKQNQRVKHPMALGTTECQKKNFV